MKPETKTKQGRNVTKQEQSALHTSAGLHATSVCVCVRVCARACVRACVGSDFVLVRECMHGPPVCFCLCSSVRVLLFAPPQGLFGFLHPAFGLRSTFEGFRQILLALCQFGSQPVQFLSSVGAGCPSLITSALLCLDLQHLLIKMCEKSLR